MKKEIVTFTALSVALSLGLTACATVTVNTNDTQSAPAATQEATADAAADTSADTKTQEDDTSTTEKTTSQKAAELDFFAGLKYSADFKQAFYVEYGSKEKAESHEGDLIYIKGEAGEYDKAKNALSFKSDDGDWIVTFDKNTTDDAVRILEGLSGTKMRVFGTFTGFSNDWDLPTMTITKDSIEHACRLEDLDGKMRITYVDTIWEDEEPDYNYYMGNLIWSGVEKWEAENILTKDNGIKLGTVSYYPVKDQSTNIYVYYEKLSKDMANWKDADVDKVLDKLTTSYLEGEEIVEKEKTKVAGLDAVRVLATVVPENSDISIDCIQYVILDKDAFYGILFAETFFIGEKMAEYEKTFMDAVRYNESGEKPRKVGASDIVAKAKIADEKSAKDNEKKGETAKKSDIQGKEFTQFIETITIVDDEEVIASSEDYDDFTFTKEELENYDETTGKLEFSEDGLSYELEFWINKDGKTEYSGTATIDGDKDVYLAASGHEK